MTPRELVLEQIYHRETNPIPYTLTFEADVGRRLDEHFGGDAWRGRLVRYMAQCGSVAKMPNERLDDTQHRDAFGTVWRTDELPSSVVEPGLKSPSFQDYAFPSPETFMDATVKAEVNKRVGESSRSFTIVSTSVCLWQSWYLRGFQNTLMDCVAEEDFYAELLDRFTELCLALVQECADVEADAIMMGDDWGNQQGVMIGPQRWRRYFKPRYARIFDAIHAQGKLAIMHCCGSVADIMGDIIEIGLDVLESVQPEAAGMNPYALKQAWGDKITFWGGLGSQYTIPFATPAEIRQEIRCLRREMGRGGGYILAPAKPLRVETPTENAVAVVEEFLADSSAV
jgi:uroporphyrinogen decarboxylase